MEVSKAGRQRGDRGRKERIKPGVGLVGAIHAAGKAPSRSMTNEFNSGLSSIQGEEETEVRVS